MKKDEHAPDLSHDNLIAHSEPLVTIRSRACEKARAEDDGVIVAQSEPLVSLTIRCAGKNGVSASSSG